MLFLLYINGIDHVITSKIKLVADDRVLYRNICNQNDQVILQNNLDTISSLAEKLLMEVNIDKCVVLSVTLKHNYSFHDYNILGTALMWVTNHNYVAVAISSDLFWLSHIKEFPARLAQALVY